MKYLTGYTLGMLVSFLLANGQIFASAMIAIGVSILVMSELKTKQNVSKNKN